MKKLLFIFLIFSGCCPLPAQPDHSLFIQTRTPIFQKELKKDTAKIKAVLVKTDTVLEETAKTDTAIAKMASAIMQINNSDLPDSSKEQLKEAAKKEKNPEISVKSAINTLLTLDNYKSLQGWRNIGIAILFLLTALEFAVRNIKWLPTQLAPTYWFNALFTKIFGKHKVKSKGLIYLKPRQAPGTNLIVMDELPIPDNTPAKLELKAVPEGYYLVLMKEQI